ncbi:uncharacterized protein [Euwallacea fornicatus]|uniref:uncharacterized protein n=1 Tax=Euwallacea fornicatus TaxID=995702 RepID=UPI00338D62C8
MTSVGIDEVLSRLSIKFNRIVYDRDFVECVNEDLQPIIDEKSKCCVLVFPALSPNYLRLVKYQAKLCDLAVISLGSGSAKSVGICHKKYFLPSPSDEDLKKNLTHSQMSEHSGNTTKKKRPAIQLYVPPAQRKSRPNVANQHQKPNKDECQVKNCPSNEKGRASARNQECLHTDISVINGAETYEEEAIEETCYWTDYIDYYLDVAYPFPLFNCNCSKLFLFKEVFPNAKLLMFSIERKKHSFHWIKCLEQKNQILLDATNCENKTVLNKAEAFLKRMSQYKRIGVLFHDVLDFREHKILSEEGTKFQNKYCLCGNNIFICVANYISHCYHSVPDFKLELDNHLHCLEDIDSELYLEKYINQHTSTINSSREIEALLNNISQKELNEELKPNCDNKINEECAKKESSSNESFTQERISKQFNQVIVLDERKEPPKIGLCDAAVEKKNKQNEHEQEKEIMRRTKQNINRKTRPIMKYVDDDNDTLNIGKSDNVNNWEELLNDEGELHEDIFREIVQKVGSDVTIVKAVEDYSAYASKQLEELEHMVELYDFPPTIETKDVMSAFSEIRSDAMYVKWVDDTHAILVLGSSSQAQKAIELSNSLIKVRPMSAASKLALEKANQFDLKPAMKRPQTNLQTARRLITSHLGARSNVSKEQSAKEREDLRVAKELKRKAKQNEKDAWEGNLRSSIN